MDLQKFKDLMVIVSFAAITAMFFYGKTFRANPQKTSRASVMEMQILRDSGKNMKKPYSLEFPLEMSQFDK